MISQIAIGTSMILITVIAAVALIVSIEKYIRNLSHVKNLTRASRLFGALVGSTLTMTLSVTVASWLWAFLLLLLGLFQDLESALYFSLVAFTTLGFGDVILTDDWRLLSGFIAANGFIVFGLGTAYILESISSADSKGEIS
ncbi:MAG: ion channel [Pseudomonadota bacterium]